MLNKVLKYDLIAVAKMLVPAYLASLVLCCVAKLTSVLSHLSIVVEVFFALTSSFAVLSMVAVFVVTMIALVARYAKNMFGAQAYLTHTLPVKTTTHLLSKYISAAIFAIATTAVIFLEISFLLFDEIFASGISEVSLVVALILLVLLGVLYYVFMIYSAVTFGQKGGRRGLRTFLAIVVMYVIEQVFAVIVLVIWALSIRTGAGFEAFAAIIYGFCGMFFVLIVAHIIFNSLLIKKLELQ